jgi:alpha-L-fucosidase
LRFTTKGKTLYAISLGEPTGRVTITSLGRAGGHEQRAVKSVRLLGLTQPLSFQQTDAALIVDVPAKLPARHASAFKISFRA